MTLKTIYQRFQGKIHRSASWKRSQIVFLPFCLLAKFHFSYGILRFSTCSIPLPRIRVSKPYGILLFRLFYNFDSIGGVSRVPAEKVAGWRRKKFFHCRCDVKWVVSCEFLEQSYSNYQADYLKMHNCNKLLFSFSPAPHLPAGLSFFRFFVFFTNFFCWFYYCFCVCFASAIVFRNY